MTVALFPGQGVQAPGMQAGLEGSAADIFAIASEVLSIDVLELCREGTAGAADLHSTRWAQPVVLACSVASFRVLEERGEAFDAVAGHSIGEYAALVCARVLDVADALRLVALRAEVTDRAAREVNGTMAAVMRAERDSIERICEATGASLAADNSAGQMVISGAVEAVDAAREQLSASGAVVRMLDVSGAFHSPVMAPAAAPLADALADVDVSAPALRVWSPTTASRVEDPEEVRRILVAQLTRPVLWRETVERIADAHVHSFIDIGPEKVVGGLVKRIVAGSKIRFATEILQTAGRSA